jgi:hypothetical protein
VTGDARTTIPRAEIASRVRSDVSAMPPGLLGRLTIAEARDLILMLEKGVAALPQEILQR